MALSTLKVPFGQMKGLMQAVDDNLLPLSYSPDCANIKVDEGALTVMRGSLPFSITPPANVTIQSVHVFYFKATGQAGYIIGTKANSGGAVKWYHNRGTALGWYEIKTEAGASLTLDPWYAKSIETDISGVEYLILTGAGTTAPVKIYYNSTAKQFYYAALGGTPPNASLITAHRDRVWLAGNSEYPNRLYYSDAFNPEDWSTAGKAGYIDIETFDGDVIAEIGNVYDDVVVAKRNTAWKVNGDTPSDYAITQIYAAQGVELGGLCSNADKCFFISASGIYQYDGTDTVKVITSEIQDVLDGMAYFKACIDGDKLYIFHRKDATSAALYKNIIINLRTQAIEVLEMQTIFDAVVQKAWKGVSDGDIIISDGTNLHILNVQAAGVTGFGDTSVAAYWYTPEKDFGYPNAEKTLTDLYFIGWGTDNAGNAGGQVKITVYYKGMNGTQKTKEKTVTLQTTKKQHDIRFSITGRLFKFKFENVNGSAINLSGITPVFEIAED
jgi:hypothetical protein